MAFGLFSWLSSYLKNTSAKTVRGFYPFELSLQVGRNSPEIIKSPAPLKHSFEINGVRVEFDSGVGNQTTVVWQHKTISSRAMTEAMNNAVETHPLGNKVAGATIPANIRVFLSPINSYGIEAVLPARDDLQVNEGLKQLAEEIVQYWVSAAIKEVSRIFAERPLRLTLKEADDLFSGNASEQVKATMSTRNRNVWYHSTYAITPFLTHMGYLEVKVPGLYDAWVSYVPGTETGPDVGVMSLITWVWPDAPDIIVVGRGQGCLAGLVNSANAACLTKWVCAEDPSKDPVPVEIRKPERCAENAGCLAMAESITIDGKEVEGLVDMAAGDFEECFEEDVLKTDLLAILSTSPSEQSLDLLVKALMVRIHNDEFGGCYLEEYLIEGAGGWGFDDAWARNMMREELALASGSEAAHIYAKMGALESQAIFARNARYALGWCSKNIGLGASAWQESVKSQISEMEEGYHLLGKAMQTWAKSDAPPSKITLDVAEAIFNDLPRGAESLKAQIMVVDLLVAIQEAVANGVHIEEAIEAFAEKVIPPPPDEDEE